MSEDDRWVTIEELANELGLSIGTIYQWRARSPKQGPRGVRLAGGKVRFRRSDVDAWLDTQADPQPA